MSTLLLKINFKGKKSLTDNVLKSIFVDVKKQIEENRLFTKKEKIYMKYKIKILEQH